MLFCFCAGLTVSVIAFVVEYLMQLQLFNEELCDRDHRPFRRRRQYLIWVALVIVITAITCFAAGCWFAVGVLNRTV